MSWDSTATTSRSRILNSIIILIIYDLVSVMYKHGKNDVIICHNLHVWHGLSSKYSQSIAFLRWSRFCMQRGIPVKEGFAHFERQNIRKVTNDTIRWWRCFMFKHCRITLEHDYGSQWLGLLRLDIPQQKRHSHSIRSDKESGIYKISKSPKINNRNIDYKKSNYNWRRAVQLWNGSKRQDLAFWDIRAFKSMHNVY